MANRSTDALSLETLLIQALTTSDRLDYDQVGAHVATALDALRREGRRNETRRQGAVYGYAMERPD